MDERAFQDILAVVHARRGLDFRDYRRDTLERRFETRLRAVGCGDLASYQERLSLEPDEVDRLVETLVVPVTEFFRDGPVFQDLAAEVVPALMERKDFVHAWVVGASTGEEAYSLAFVLAGAAQGRDASFQVVATDIDRRSLVAARAGVYDKTDLAGLPVELRARFFQEDAAGFRVSASIRERVQFIEHDVMGTTLAPREAIVASFDLILCRNVLLYFDDGLRAKAIDRLTALVEPGGGLVLGTSESLPEGVARSFRPWPRTHAGGQIFRRGPHP